MMTDHLVQSTIFAAVAGLLTMALRKNHARARYWVWFAASMKFLVPFSLFAEIGRRVRWPGAAAVAHPGIVSAVNLVSHPFGLSPVAPADPAAGAASIVPTLLFALWSCGCAAVLVFWCVRWRRATNALRSAALLEDGREMEILRTMMADRPIEVLSSPLHMEPAVFGFFRQRIVLPAGLGAHLSDEQVRAIFAHELCHVRRRDNLTAAMHMAVESAFWFHPLVWWIGSRLVEERERACDEEVVERWGAAEAYAESILKVCRLYLGSSLPCAAGVSGATLSKRIETIMQFRSARQLSVGVKILMGSAAAVMVGGALLTGIVQAQSGGKVEAAKGPTSFDVVSIKPNNSGSTRTRMNFSEGMRLVATNLPARSLITDAWGLRGFQVVGGPGWLETDRFDVEAKVSAPIAWEGVKLCLRNLLAERFKLRAHTEMRESPIYVLVVDKGAPKFSVNSDPAAKRDMSVRPKAANKTQMQATKVSMTELVANLANQVDRIVVDKTGLVGEYDFTIEFDPTQAGDDIGPSIFTALQEQLGLRLQAQRGPVEHLIIENVERPSEN